MLFKDVLADENLKRQLVTLIKTGRVSHAQLFLGQAGSHSFALAVAYAQYLSCDDPGEWDSCGVCPSCIKYGKLEHPDLHLIFPNATTKSVKKDPDSRQLAQEFRHFVMERQYHIDLEEWLLELGGENKQASINIRDCANIINQNSVRSYEGGYKVYILWMVERLYYAAAPKLLKTLEEPENRTLFILIAQNSDRILPTILSRTQLVKIPRLTNEMISSQLMSELGTTQEIASDIAEISEGNYIKAVSLFKEHASLKKMVADFELFMKSIFHLSTQSDNTKIDFFELQALFTGIIDEGRERQKSFLRFTIRMFRNMLLMNTRNEDLIRATAYEKKLLEFFKQYITLRNITSILDECNQAIYHIERNGNSSLIFNDLYLKLAQHLAPPVPKG